MATRQFPLASLFLTIFWIAGALALGRLAWSSELGNGGHRFAVCVLTAWVGTAIGSYLKQPGWFALAGLGVGLLYTIFAAVGVP